ncbi:hypothetical protein QQZ08_004588 [Neonectria magnoliae]|uniref:Uncharacterized protein n=1 Tax=Neonectria magnoliae TaxID=2732573 RepID=A0ABR1I5H4_9HYPO
MEVTRLSKSGETPPGLLMEEIASFANEHPEGFLSHLQSAWERDGDQAVNTPDVLKSLKSISAICEDGKKRPLATTYLPERELLFLRGKYMLPEETFPFLKLPKSWTQSAPLDVSSENTKQLLFSLSDNILEHGHLLDPSRFLSSKVLPIKETDGRVHLDSSDAEFYIVDRKSCQCFAERVPVLDFTPHEIWRLEPLLVWADLESRYLSWNVADTTHVIDPAPELLSRGFTAAKARGLIRIASHFRSPRVKNQGLRKNLLQKLERAKFFQSRQICRHLTLQRLHSIDVTCKMVGQLHIQEGHEELKIFVPHGPEAQDLSAASLPHALVVWLMADPDSGLTERVNEVAVSLVKSISTIRDTLISRVLDDEEVVRLEDLGSQADDG